MAYDDLDQNFYEHQTVNHIEAMWQHGATDHDMTPDYLAEFRWSQRLKQSRGHVVLRYRDDNHHAVGWIWGTVTTTVRLTVALSYYFDIFTKLKGGGEENAVAPHPKVSIRKSKERCCSKVYLLQVNIIYIFI